MELVSVLLVVDDDRLIQLDERLLYFPDKTQDGTAVSDRLA